MTLICYEYTNIMVTVGYTKDLIALIFFSLALFLTLFRLLPYIFIIIGLILCVFVDLLFTLNPDWHCSELGKNMGTYAVIIQSILGTVAFGVLFYLEA